MINLQVEILEIFAEAQYLGRPRKLRVHPPWDRRGDHRFKSPLKKMKERRAYLEKDKALERVQRARYEIVPCSVDREICSYCGRVVEHREGSRQAFHVGGPCIKPKAA